VAAKQPQFSPKQVASALQASESSVKRWCDQGAISTIRTVGGHRKITLDALQHFLRSSNRPLIAPQALGLSPNRVATEGMIPGGQDHDQKQFRTALAQGDEDACRRILRMRVGLGASRSEAADFLITDAMHGIGEAWDCQRVDAYQERRGCEICTRLLGELRSELPTLPASSPVALGGTLSGDPYQLPTALVELALRESGWDAMNLGSNLPAESLLQAVSDHRPRLVWLSVSSIEDPEQFIRQENLLAEKIGDEVALLIGGRALTDEIRPKLRYTAHCDSLRHLVDFAFMMRMQG
jgi:excisionase family DNA binding protein